MVFLIVGPASATEYWYVDAEAQAFEYNEEEDDYETPVPVIEVVVYSPWDDEEDEEDFLPADLYKDEQGEFYWGSGPDWYKKDEENWSDIPAPTLILTLPTALLLGQFISNETTHHVTAEGGIGEIIWEQLGDFGTSGILSFNGSGNTRSFLFGPDVALNTRADALKYKIQVSADPSLTATGSMVQDAISKLRQQYLDRDLKIPTRGGRWLSGSSIKIQTDLETNFAKLEAKYTKWVRLTNQTVTVDLRIESADRTPRRNAELAEEVDPDPAHKSLHQYGCAYDISPIPYYGGNASTQSDDADRLVTIWRDSLGFKKPKGYTYKKSNNSVHVQILEYNAINEDVNNP